MHRATFTLEDTPFAFMQQHGGRNKSAFINELLKKEMERQKRAKFLQSNLEEAADTAMWEELEAWDVTLLDGLSDDDA